MRCRTHAVTTRAVARSGLLGAGVLAMCLALSACSMAGDDRERVHPTSGAHAAQLLRDCLRDEGWDAQISSRDGGVVSEYPTAQEDRYIEDVGECSTAIGMNDVPELSPEQYELLYAELIEASRCLAELGFDLPEAPSVTVFIETKAQWSPFALLPEMSIADFDAAVAECPPPQLW